MKKTTLSIIASIALLSNTLQADWWQDTKVVANKVKFWKSKHLKDIDFEHIYPKKFYKKSYFAFAITGVAIVGAGAFTYVTAGAGAPTAVTGVGGVAAWVGGVAISGKAILGVTLLSSIVIATLGDRVDKTTFRELTVLEKVRVMASVTAIGLDGVTYFKNSKTNKLEYKVMLMIPKKLGSKDTRDIVNRIYEIDEKIQDNLEDNKGKDNDLYLEMKTRAIKDALVLLEKKLTEKDNQEDLIVLSIIASNKAEYELFDKAINQIDSSKLDNSSFLNYLKALNSLHKIDEKKSLEYLDNSISENPYALEPVILSINILGNSNFLQNEVKIKDLVKNAEENFDSDDYATSYSLSGLYYRVATFYFNNQRYASAQKYYEKAYDELGMLQKNFFGKELGHTIQLGIANSLYKEGKTKKALEVYNDIIEDFDEDEKRKITEQYLGNE